MALVALTARTGAAVLSSRGMAGGCRRASLAAFWAARWACSWDTACCIASSSASVKALAIASIGQTIPSLALFGFLIPIPFIGGIGKRTAIVALVLYALLPILRNTLAGILGVDSAVRESAIAMGMTGRQLLWEVELPLAAPTIIAGVITRTSRT